MSITLEIERLIRDNDADATLFDNTKLIDEYQELLEKGLVKQRGYTLQTIEQRQGEMLKTARICYFTGKGE